VKDVVSSYWLQYKMATIELGETGVAEHALKSKFAIVTIHDVSPAYSKRIIRAADALAELDIPFGFAIIPRFRMNQEYDIGSNSDWVARIKSYKQPMVLHGLYHEDNVGAIEDFHNFSFDEAMKHLKNGLSLLAKAGISTNVFVPPTWAVNKDTLEALARNGISLVETDEEILLLNKNTRLHTSILNCDRGSSNFNRLSIEMNRREFRQKILQNSQMVRMAIHPKDDDLALSDQKEMIQGLKDMNYNFLSYDDVMQFFG